METEAKSAPMKRIAPPKSRLLPVHISGQNKVCPATLAWESLRVSGKAKGCSFTNTGRANRGKIRHFCMVMAGKVVRRDKSGDRD